MVFYNPFMLKLGVTPTIVYPSKGVEAVFDRKDKGCIERFLAGLYDLNKGLISQDTEYLLSMLWTEDDTNRMTDLWIFRKSETYGFGPLVDVKVFKGLEPYTPNPERVEGIGSGNTIVLLAAEENHRVSVGNLKEYLSGTRPELPERIRLDQDFYLS